MSKRGKKGLISIAYGGARRILGLWPTVGRERLLESARCGNGVVVEERYSFHVTNPLGARLEPDLRKFTGLHNVPDFFGVVVQSIRLVGPFAVPFDRFGRIIVEPVSSNWLPTVLSWTIREMGVLRFLLEVLRAACSPLRPSNESDVDFGALLVCRGRKSSGQPVFGHWVGEQLPQIRAIRAVEDLQGRTAQYIVESEIAGFQYDTLEVMGVNKEHLFFHRGDSTQVRNLIVSSLRNVHSRGMEVDPRARIWVRNKVSEHHEITTPNRLANRPAEKVALLREHNSDRSFHVDAFTEKILSEAGVMRLDDSSTTSHKSLSSFKETRVLLALSGSGLLNMLFSPKLERVIELTTPDFQSREVFFLLSAELGVDYCRIETLPSPSSDGPPSNVFRLVDEGTELVESLRPKMLRGADARRLKALAHLLDVVWTEPSVSLGGG